MEPLSVAVRRNALIEARHRVHAAAVRAGETVEAAGDSALVAFFRSSAKPFQALPLARARADVDEIELAIACASHQAEEPQLAAVRSLLARAPAGVDELECGPQEGRGSARIAHNCSGKHAGMLALCRARCWRTEGYHLQGHPLQQAMLAEVAAAAEVEAAEIPTAVDGCGVVTFALSLERMAHAFSRLAGLDGGGRVAGAMAARPGLVGGIGADDTALMLALPDWIAKRGAEGLLCAASPDGLGIALKVEDGGQRAVRPALAAFLAGLGVELDEDFRRVPVRNSRDELVGEVVGEPGA